MPGVHLSECQSVLLLTTQITNTGRSPPAGRCPPSLGTSTRPSPALCPPPPTAPRCASALCQARWGACEQFVRAHELEGSWAGLGKGGGLGRPAGGGQAHSVPSHCHPLEISNDTVSCHQRSLQLRGLKLVLANGTMLELTPNSNRHLFMAAGEGRGARWFRSPPACCAQLHAGRHARMAARHPPACQVACLRH